MPGSRDLAFSPPNAPTGPNYFVCDPLYGMQLEPSSCISAGLNLPIGKANLPYTIDQSGARYALPWSMAADDCRISVEVAGPAEIMAYTAKPDDIRGLAEWLVSQCVSHSGGIGGFLTKDIGNLIGYVTAPQTDIYGLFPARSSFLTISVTNAPQKDPLPGNHDPSVAAHLADAETAAWENAPPGSEIRIDFARRSQYFMRQSTHMRRGGTIPWWSIWPGSEGMSYECDATLGTPGVVDCTQIQMHQMGPLNETFEVGPGKTKFLSSNTCNLAISARESTLLSWWQVRSAIGNLMDTCVLHPGPGQGGRAYVEGPQPALSSRAISTQINTTDAYSLPPGASITLFAQPADEPIGNENSCAWQAITNRRPITSCGTVINLSKQNPTAAHNFSSTG